jgi:hypothetical protein
MNIHTLPTSQPSRIVKQKYDTLDRLCLADIATKRAEYKRFNIYITSDEGIKEGDWVLGDFPDNPIGKVISKYGQEFTAQSLNGNKYGLAEYDSKKIILTTDQDLQKDGVQAIDDEFLEWFVKNISCEKALKDSFKEQENMYSEEEVFNLLICRNIELGISESTEKIEKWFKQFKKK